MTDISGVLEIEVETQVMEALIHVATKAKKRLDRKIRMKRKKRWGWA